MIKKKTNLILVSATTIINVLLAGYYVAGFTHPSLVIPAGIVVITQP